VARTVEGPMDLIDASLERLKALWAKLARAKPHSREYDALSKALRAESTEYQALIKAEKDPFQNDTASSEG
jgi:hypothetical protein